MAFPVSRARFAGLRRSLGLAGLVIGPLMLFACSGSEAGDTKPVYVALGASDAVGVGATRPTEEGWVPLVHSALERDTQLLNLGISGATLSDVIASELPVAEDVTPTLVTLWPGVNDLRSGAALDRFRRQLDEILMRVRDGEGTTVVVVNIPDLRYLPVFASANPETLDATVREWNTAIEDAVAEHDAILVDLYGSSLELDEHPEYVSGDGFHPSSAGYRRIADLVLAAIETHVPALR